MRKRPILSLLLSVFVPGLGHIYAGNGNKGAAILASSIIIGSLNIIFLPIFISANPDPGVVWSYWIPRIGHDVLALWSLVFWIWVIADSYQVARSH